MNTPLKVSVVVPALNEESTIGDIVAGILAVNPDYEVIVVDDGSADGTAQAARDSGAVVISHPYNLGNGASVTAGSLAASGDIIVMIDADGQHPPECIPMLIEHMGAYDMVVGARTRHSKTSRRRAFGNFILNKIASWISGHPIKDLTSGFRAIKRKHLLEYIHLFPARYSYPTTITMAMIQGRHFVKYVPVDAIQRRHFGRSNIKPIRDFIRFLNIMMRLLVLFSPQKFFLPLSALTLVFGMALGLYQLITHGGLFGSSQLLLLSAVYFFCFGLLAEQIAFIRRQVGRSGQNGEADAGRAMSARSDFLERQGEREVELRRRHEVKGK
ncbi:MAG: glycosyltransferase family 2 protein [Ferrovibrio sp.]